MAAADQVTNASSRGIELLDQVDYRLMETDADRDAIYRLRYDAYLKEGTIQPNPSRKVTDRYDDMPNSWTFGVYFEGVLSSSIRISVGSAGHPETPSMDVFPDLLKPELAAGKVYVDPTRFVADSAQARRFAELPYLTVRLAYVACSYFNADLGLATVRSEHQAFYRRVFMHEPMTGPREYPGLIKPICLMAVDFPEMRDKVFARYPFLRSSYFERRKLFERQGQGSAGSAPELAFERASIVPRA